MGNGNNLDIVDPPLGYLEFMPDSIARSYSYDMKIFKYYKYWVDSLLHRVESLPNNVDVRLDYSMEFKTKNNEMHLNHRNFNAWYNTMIYKRSD